ncbi:MAG: ATP-binding protein [Acidaminococcaceae bacterium]|nr:ATP-binding protein [Acidaminococcaceae bacterium]
MKRQFIIVFASVLIFVLTMSFIMGKIYGYFADNQKTQLKIQMFMIAQGVEYAKDAYFKNLELGNYRVTWISPDGVVLYDSRENKAEMENHLERREVQEAFASGYGESQRYSSTMLKKMLYSAKLLNDGSVVRLSVPQNTVFSLMLDMAVPIGAALFSVIVLAALLAARETRKANLEATETMRREFTANVSHELKTPIHSISGYAELIKNGMASERDVPAFAGKIYDEAQRMTRLVQDIISLSRLDEGQENMNRMKVNLYQLAEGIKNELEAFAKENKVTLELIGDNVVMDGIPQLLHSMVYNICENAIKYNRPQGNVIIHVESVNNHPQISVRDSGIGIPEKDRQRIFERFYRVDKSHSKAVGGTGLGLSIVKHAAKLHNAKVEVDSIVGEGTMITVSFS